MSSNQPPKPPTTPPNPPDYYPPYGDSRQPVYPQQPFYAPQQPQYIYIQQPEPKSNGLGVAGFVLAMLGLLLCWVPVLDWILWVLGLIFSFIGVFKQPRGFAIAGLVISLIGLVILIAFVAIIAAILTI